MQDFRDAGKDGCRKEGMNKGRDLGLEKFRNRWIQKRRDTGKEGSGQEGCGTGDMLDSRVYQFFEIEIVNPPLLRQS